MKQVAKHLIVVITLIVGFSQTVFAANNDAELENAILTQINSYRLKHGLGKLTMNPQISQEARRHSADMANHSVPFGHTYFMSRINRLHSKIKNSGAGAENVAYNYKDAEDVVKNWLKSPGHKHNIDGNYNLTGIGVARDKQGKIYFTQMFIKTGANKQYAQKRFGSRIFVSPFLRMKS